MGMGLEDFLSEDTIGDAETYHDNPKLDKKKLFEPHLCPSCGNEAEHVRNSQYRCTEPQDVCDTLYYFSVNRDNA